MWFTDVITRAGQYAYGQANAAYVMLTDAFGAPLNTPGGALSTFETAAMGYDPSIGRTPVEQSNSFFNQLGATAGVAIKAAPGFLHSVSVAAQWTSTAAIGSNCVVNIALYDSSSPANPVFRKSYLATQGIGATGGAFVFPPTEEIDALFTAGLYLVLTTTDGANGTLSFVTATVTYR